MLQNNLNDRKQAKFKMQRYCNITLKLKKENFSFYLRERKAGTTRNL